VPVFDREKCVHCVACIWKRAQPLPDNPERTDIAFRACTDGLPPAENKHSRAEFQLSQKCVWRMMRLFVAAMEKPKIADYWD
jgi:ferredoxin